MSQQEYEDSIEIAHDNGNIAYRIVQCSRSASRHKENEDYLGFAGGEKHQQVTRGNLWVLADGLSGGKGGRVAAELLVRQLIEGYQQVASSLSVQQALARSLAAVNKSLFWHSRNDPHLDGMAAAFCALVMRGWECYVCFAGDVRCYRWRGQKVELLTTDHVMKIGGGHLLSRAVGLDEALQAEMVQVDIENGDVLWLMSDGCHKYLSPTEMREIMLTAASITDAMRNMKSLALANGSADDISIGIMEIIDLPKKGLRFFEDMIFSVPLGHVPGVGATIDDYYLREKIHEGFYSVIFAAEDLRRSGSNVVLKFPKSRASGDDNIRRSFAKEDWVASVISGPWLLTTAADGRSRSQIYTVSPWYRGVTLLQWMQRRPVSWVDGLRIARQVGRGLYELHRHHIVHRDVKPENILILDNGEVLLIDYGFARVPGALDPAPSEAPGTLAYMAPELLNGALGDSRTDVYSLGVTLYQMFSGGKSPFGTQGYRSLKKNRVDCPVWLDRVLAKMLAVNPEERYSDTLELLHELERWEGYVAQDEVVRKEPRWKVREVVVLRVVILILIFVLLIVMQIK